MTTAQMKDEYGKLLFAGIGSMSAIQYIGVVAMNSGYAPFVGISLPFVSYGGTDQVIQFGPRSDYCLAYTVLFHECPINPNLRNHTLGGPKLNSHIELPIHIPVTGSADCSSFRL
jgi:hypothetical protein